MNFSNSINEGLSCTNFPVYELLQWMDSTYIFRAIYDDLLAPRVKATIIFIKDDKIALKN